MFQRSNLISYDGLGDEVKHYVSMPEKWLKTTFDYVKDWDPKRKMIVKNCTGPGSSETVYTLEFCLSSESSPTFSPSIDISQFHSIVFDKCSEL